MLNCRIQTRDFLVVATAILPLACGHPAAPAQALPPAPPAASAGSSPASSAQVMPVVWPDSLAATMGPHGPPHSQPVALPRDAQGSDRWLAFVGPPEVAVAAWRVSRRTDGTVSADPVERWPTAVRVTGAVVEDGAAYVTLETVGALDQPAGLRGVWIDALSRSTPFEGSPLALADARTMDDLAARVRHPAPMGSPERNATALLATLRAASSSTGALVRAIATEGADVGLVWQSTFVQTTAHLDGQGNAPSPAADHALAIVHDALETHACGTDTCESWTDGSHAIVRFVVQGGRWVIRWLLEDATPLESTAGASRSEVQPTPDASATAALLHARSRNLTRVLGEAPLMTSGGTIGVGLTDLAPDAPVIALTEGSAARVFVMDAVTARHGWTETHWDAGFADVDGDGRTDVVLRMEGTGSGAPVTWTQAFLAPSPSVQAGPLRADLASSLSTMDAADLQTAVHAATVLPARGVAREDACRVLSTASTPAGFRRVASADARVLLFDQPGMPTWLPKVVPSAKVGADDVRGLGTHCAELTCSAMRPYCVWSGGTDSEHVWFGWRGSDLTIVGAADYDGE